MVSEAPGEGPGSRRGLLKAVGAGAAALIVAACGHHDSLRSQLKREPAVAQTDIALLNHLLDIEHKAVAAYTAGGPLLDPVAAKAARQFLAQELAHASTLDILVRVAGGKSNKPLPSYNLGNPRSSEDVLRLLHSIETAQIAAYLDAIPRLAPSPVRTMVAEVFANDAQHISVVRSLLGEAPAPAPFVSGRE